MQGADVGMIQRRNGARFALKALLQIGVGRKMRRQNLDGNGAVQSGVLGAIDPSHASSA
jgi:hypothetical protein